MRQWIALWLASLVAVATFASALTYAQTRRAGRIISGEDVGVRLEGADSSGRSTGSLMIRVDGRWIVVHRFELGGAVNP
jgi:hypothetical protein